MKVLMSNGSLHMGIILLPRTSQLPQSFALVLRKHSGHPGRCGNTSTRPLLEKVTLDTKWLRLEPQGVRKGKGPQATQPTCVTDEGRDLYTVTSSSVTNLGLESMPSYSSRPHAAPTPACTTPENLSRHSTSLGPGVLESPLKP